MNWLQKTCQSLPPTYLDVGHGFRWNEETNEREEIWRAKNAGDIILWYYKDGKMHEEEEFDSHWIEGDEARGRIETNNNRGSIDFANNRPYAHRKILSDLVDKYPGVKFAVYGTPGGPFSLQDYWESIS